MLGLILRKAHERNAPPQNFAIVEENLQKRSRALATTWPLAAFLVVVLLGLPLALFFDLRAISAGFLQAQSRALDRVVSSIRDYYADTIVASVQRNPHNVVVTAHFEGHPGAIPIPATFSLALGGVISRDQRDVRYRFLSNLPFKGRAPHHLDHFERAALRAFATHPAMTMTSSSWHGLTTEVRYATPIVMAASCVACHNADPNSPKRDWKVGEVGGLQELILTEPLAMNLYSFKYLLLYILIALALGTILFRQQRRQAAIIDSANAELSRTNDALVGLSSNISRYISPQIYESIFSGRTGTELHTQRKKLTIFFSDIKDFTATSERLAPEELTAVLNEYFDEMSAIALQFGGTIDKFVGDAMLVFFGDPESAGVVDDAAACVRMAIAMQARLAELSARWRNRGIERPFRARMGINTGFVNVGNFGSSVRMDYTIIGAEVNLAARLETVAEPGSIVLSYETYALVRELVAAHSLAPISVKGIPREIVPYVLDGLRDEASVLRRIFSEHAEGIDLYIDVDALDAAARERARALLLEAANSIESPFDPRP